MTMVYLKWVLRWAINWQENKILSLTVEGAGKYKSIIAEAEQELQTLRGLLADANSYNDGAVLEVIECGNPSREVGK